MLKVYIPLDSKNLFSLIAALFIFTYTSGQPIIKSFTPTAGPFGSVVTIVGNHFSDTATENIVYFGAMQGTVLTSTDSTITVTVPSGATYENLSVTTGGLTAYASQPFIITFGSDLITENSFASKMSFASGDYVFNLDHADMDGDGKTDIMCANFSDNTISVFRNLSTEGNIAYVQVINISGLSGPSDIMTSDADGDGKLDMIVIYQTSKTVSVYRNLSSPGNISFASRIDYSTDIRSYAVFGDVGDLNGDGKPEFALANSQSNTVSVYQNESTPGNISFRLPIDFTTETGPQGVAIADLDGDKKPDMAVSNYFSNSVSVFRNTSKLGSISFAQAKNFIVGIKPYQIETGDLDNNNEPDIVTANTFGNSVSVLRNSGTGSIAFDPKKDYPLPSNVTSVAIGDVNGDGHPDLAVAGSDINIAVLQNQGKSDTIDFSDNTYLSLRSSSDYVTIGDEDGDSKPELIVGYGFQFAIFRNVMTSTLAVKLFNFTGRVIGKDIQLQWQTSNEENIGSYTIERSTNGIAFYEISKMLPLNNSSHSNSYTYLDKEAQPGKNYYKIKLIDKDGTIEFGNIVQVNIDVQVNFKISPNPAANYVVAQRTSGSSPANVRVIDLSGNTVRTAGMKPNEFQTSINLEGLADGMYRLIWSDGKNTGSTNLFIKH